MGTRITRSTAVLTVPDTPLIPSIEGDGTGPDIWRAARRVFDEAGATAHAGRRSVDFARLVPGAIQVFTSHLTSLIVENPGT